MTVARDRDGSRLRLTSHGALTSPSCSLAARRGGEAHLPFEAGVTEGECWGGDREIASS